MEKTQKPVLMVDVDGVIVTGRVPDGHHWSTDLLRDHGIETDALKKHFFRPFWAEIITGKDSLLPRLQQALKAMNADVDAVTLQNYWFTNHSRLNGPVLDWIAARRAADYRVMLATNQDHSRATFLMHTLGLSAHCDGIYHSAALGVAKPDRAFFDMISRAEGRDPGDLFLIDDTAANITAAISTGWRAHRYTGQSLDHIT